MQGRSGRAALSRTAVLAGVTAALAAAVGWWRLSLLHAPPAAVPREPWERVQQEYPLPPEEMPRLSGGADVAESLVAANPFSPERRRAPPQPGEQGAGERLAAATPPPPPRFVYKGRVQLGARQRAVVEETTARKTYFLEVGQEVAGFKVLDIDEKRVLLSNLQTHEEVAVSLTSTASPAFP